jgi:clan AA aspartic protease
MRSTFVGTVRTEITLKNVSDVIKARDGIITDAEIRAIIIEKATVDTGAMSLVINEAMRQQLGLAVIEQRMVRIANGERVPCGMTEPVEIHWKTRLTTQHAVVLPTASQVLLGVVPLEAMDLMVDPVNQQLVGVHGDIVMETV